MEPTTSGQYRVLTSPHDADELLLIDVEDHDPTYVSTDGYDGELATSVADLEPGYLVAATLAWDDGTPRFSEIDVESRTLLEFVDGATNIFEAAQETWAEAERAGEPFNSRVTYSTDGETNGVVYVFAKQSGARDLFEEFRSGVRPLEPLIQRLSKGNEGNEDHEVFVLRPRDEPFVLVYLVREKGSMLADTVRDTYDCPRP